MSIFAATAEPLLRTLAPALRQLHCSLRGWIDGMHRFPLSTLTRASLEGLATDLHRQAEAFNVDRPLLIIVLMGGTGVGKSTLLNALAGGAIAQASLARPTTRDPVVYYHQSVRPDRLDPALRHCRLAPHDRPGLEQKVIIDTPDLDSNDLANREKLQAILPVADVVLYVGSQEKYHDKLGWELFLQQRRRRAFAFVLNKWDRCLRDNGDGVRPDEDLLRDLRTEGFDDPLLFRTCAQAWIGEAEGENERGREGEKATADTRHDNNAVPFSPSPHLPLSPSSLPQGEQFTDLVQWLEKGLTRLEIEAIKARGVAQLLQQLQSSLATACPPDLTTEAERTAKRWQQLLAEEAEADADVLLKTLDPYQREIEHHFTVEGQRRFRGIMAAYLNFFTRAKYVSNTLRDRVPFLPRAKDAVSAPATWDLATFTRGCTDVAANRHLDARGKALSNRLLVEADGEGYPLNLLAEPVEAAAKLDWRQRYSQALVDTLQEVERQWASPTGVRRWVQTTLVFVADWVPILSLLAALLIVLWRFFDPTGQGYNTPPSHFVLPFMILLVVLIILHLLIALLLPLRWPKIRGEFQRKLERRLLSDLQGAYIPIPADVAQNLVAERRRIEELLAETREVARWLDQREQAANIGALYGK